MQSFSRWLLKNVFNFVTFEEITSRISLFQKFICSFESMNTRYCWLWPFCHGLFVGLVGELHHLNLSIYNCIHTCAQAYAHMCIHVHTYIDTVLLPITGSTLAIVKTFSTTIKRRSLALLRDANTLSVTVQSQQFPYCTWLTRISSAMYRFEIA